MIWRSKVATFVVLVAALFGDVVSWAPSNNHSAKSSKPMSATRRPIISKTDFHQWAATGMVAASLVLNPLPSPAAADTLPGDAVRVEVDGTSLVIKLDLPELKAGLLGAKNVKAVIKQVPPSEEVSENSESVDKQASKATAVDVKPSNEDVKPVEETEEPKDVEKSMIEKMSEVLIPSKEEKTETAKENVIVETKSVEIEAPEADASKLAPTDQPKPTEKVEVAEKSMFEKVSEALIPSKEEKTEPSKENAVAETKSVEANLEAASKTREEQKPVETRTEEPKAVEKSMIEKVSEVLIPSKEEKAEPPKESVVAESKSVEAKVEPPSELKDELKPVETKTEEPRAVEKSMIEKVSEALIPTKEEKTEPFESVAIDKKVDKAVIPAQKEEPKTEVITKEEAKVNVRGDSKLSVMEEPKLEKSSTGVAPSVPVSKKEESKSSEVQVEELKPVEAKKKEPEPLDLKKEETKLAEEKNADTVALVDQTKEAAEKDDAPKPEQQETKIEESTNKRLVVESSARASKTEELSKERIAEVPKVIPAEPKSKGVTGDVKKSPASVEMNTVQSKTATSPVVADEKEQTMEEATKATDIPKPKPGPMITPRTPVLSSQENILNKFWNDFVSDHTETKELASKTTFTDVPYWERPAFRVTVQKQMDGKQGLRLVFSNLDVARASVVGIGLASAVNFLYLRPMLGDGDGNESEKENDPGSKVPVAQRKPERTIGTAKRPANDFTVPSGGVSLSKVGSSYADRLGASSKNNAPTYGDSAGAGGYLGALSNSSPASSDPSPSKFSSAKGSGASGGVDPSVPGSQVSLPRPIPPPYDASSTDNSYGGDNSGRRERIGKRTRLPGSNGRLGPDEEYKPDIGIIYYDSDEIKEREQKTEERNEAQQSTSGSGSYLDDLSSNVNGYNRKRTTRNRGGADVFPFRKD